MDKMRKRQEERKMQLTVMAREVGSRDAEGDRSGDEGGDETGEDRPPGYEREARDVPPVYEEVVVTPKNGNLGSEGRAGNGRGGDANTGESSVHSGFRYLV